MNQKKRNSFPIGYFNMLKGVGMVFIISFHCAMLVGIEGKAGEIFSVFGAGIMAMFFLLSGYGFIPRQPKKYMLSLMAELLCPYAIVAILVILCKLILSFIRHRSFMDHGFEYVLTYFLGLNASGGGLFMGLPVESVGIFWFVLALFIGLNVLNLIMQIPDDRVQVILVISSVVAGYLLTRISNVWIYQIPNGLICTGYLYSGYMMKKKELLFRSLSGYSYLILVSISAIALVFSYINTGCCEYRMGLFDIIAMGAMSFLMIRWYTVIRRKMTHSLPVRVLDTIGYYSIYIICIHSFESIILPWYILRAISSSPVVIVVSFIVIRGLVIAGGIKGILWVKKLFRRRKPKVKLEF